MAALATTPTVVKKKFSNPGPLVVAVISVPLDGSYVAGGYAAFQAYVRTALHMPGFELLGFLMNECAGYLPVYDKTNDKLKIYFSNDDAIATVTQADGSDAASTQALANDLKSKINAAADGPLIENSVGNLAAITLQLVVVGF